MGCLLAFPVREGGASLELHLEEGSIKEACGVLAHRRSRTVVTTAVLFSATLPCLAPGRFSSTLVRDFGNIPYRLPQEDKTPSWPHSAPEIVTMGQRWTGGPTAWVCTQALPTTTSNSGQGNPPLGGSGLSPNKTGALIGPRQWGYCEHLRRQRLALMGSWEQPRGEEKDRRVPALTFPQSSQSGLGQLGRRSWFKVL